MTLDMVSAGATFPGNPHLPSHFQKSRGGMFVMAGAGAASESGAWGRGRRRGQGRGEFNNKLLSDFVISSRALAEKHLQLAHGK